MHHLETSIDIEAPPERVWALLMDFPAYGRWNPFVRSIEGRASVSEVLKVVIQPPGGRATQFRPRVLAYEPNREFRWKGNLLLPGLFDGEHFFKIEPKPDGGSRFVHGELFSGLLVPLFKRSLDGATRRGFVAMNEAVKREAERSR